VHIETDLVVFETKYTTGKDNKRGLQRQQVVVTGRRKIYPLGLPAEV
jgi:hypothetical protein